MSIAEAGEYFCGPNVIVIPAKWQLPKSRSFFRNSGVWLRLYQHLTAKNQ
ncbi:hypothetical protein LRQ05_11240 [Pseudomonas bubulae]|nr:hypothetical protein [Pseudomonas bubulae]